MNKAEFKNIIEKQILLFDGGFGTELYNRGIFLNRCFEELNLSNPSLVKQIHEDYLKAGADIVETNTYGANRFKLKKHQLDDKIYDINYNAGIIAKEAAGEDKLVSASIGPLGIQIEPLGPTSREEAIEYFKEQIKPLIDAEVDLILFETFIYIDELSCAVDAAKQLSDIPIIASITINDEGNTLTGGHPETVVKQLEQIGADAIGVNCTVGPRVMLNWLEKVRNYTDLPLSVMPNAGKPKNIDGRNIYLTSPEYIGEYAKHFINAGANIIGGCCGTNPDHIKRMRNMINAMKPELSKRQYAKIKEEELIEVETVAVEKKSRLSRRMKDGHFTKFVELLAPMGVNAKVQIEKSREMNFYGIDVINIPDGPRASARMSALSLAVQIKQQVGIEPVLHYVCRDRNVIGIQSDLLGAYALGVTNILAITGDPPKLGNYPDATAVFDVDSIGLVNILNRLNHGLDIAGNPIGDPTGFHVGVGVNPGAVNLDEEIARLEWKVEAGAEYMITQPVFDLKIFENFINKTQHIKIPLVAGLWPLVSIRNAEFMNNEIPGCHVPDDVLTRLRAVSNSKEKSLMAGIEVARETLDSIQDKIAGIQISAPFGRVQSVIDVLDGFNL